MRGPEAQIQKAITDWLSANGLWFMRVNTGAVMASYGGKTRMVRFAKPGTADLLVTKEWFGVMSVNWCEIKTPSGKQSPDQQLFEAEVVAAGHRYVIFRSLDDAIAYFS